MTPPFFLFAPGAGAPSSSAWMQAWSRRLSTLGPVQTLDYPYMRQGQGQGQGDARRRPDPPAVLIAAHQQALAQVLPQAGDGTLVLIGKSMGSRMGCHVAAAGTPGIEPNRLRLVCLGYPLKSASSGALRDQVLLQLATPILFVQGTRDPLCPLAALAEVRAKMTAPNQLHIVQGGDHSLAVSAQARKQAGITQNDSDANVLEVIRRFVTDVAP